MRRRARAGRARPPRAAHPGDDRPAPLGADRAGLGRRDARRAASVAARAPRKGRQAPPPAAPEPARRSARTLALTASSHPRPIRCSAALRGARLQPTILAGIIRRATYARGNLKARDRAHAAPHRRDVAAPGDRRRPPGRRVPRPLRPLDRVAATRTSQARSCTPPPRRSPTVPASAGRPPPGGPRTHRGAVSGDRSWAARRLGVSHASIRCAC